MTIDEPIFPCTAQNWVDRYSGARDTFIGLKILQARVAADCSQYASDIFNEIVAQVDGYAMDMRALLLMENHFQLDDEGHLQIPPAGIRMACERRRGRIKKFVYDLLDSGRAPVLTRHGGSNLETFEEKKTLFHRKTAEMRGRLERGETAISERDADRCGDSDWAFDRIMLYVAQELKPTSDLPKAIDRVKLELEKARSHEENISLIPLHYALGAGAKTLQADNKKWIRERATEINVLLTDIEEFVDQKKLDRGRQLRRTVTEIRGLMQVNESQV